MPSMSPWFYVALFFMLCVIILAVAFPFAICKYKRLTKKQKHELDLKTATLSTVFDSIPDLYCVKDLNLVITECNKALLEHYGISREDIIGSCTKEGVEGAGYTEDEIDTYSDCDLRAITEKRPIIIEERIPHFSGSKPLFETIKIPIFANNTVVGIVAVARDITLRKEAEQAIIATSRSKTKFIVKKNEEYRRLVNEISEAADKGEIDKIQSLCTQMLGAIDDVLDYANLEVGNLEITPRQYCLESLLRDLIKLNTGKISGKHILFELQIDENIPAQLIGDALRIKQVINRLISNAFKYTERGSVILSVSYETTVLRPKSPKDTARKQLIITVKDTGCGIPEEQLGTLFDGIIEGVGFGLTFTQRLLALMDGEISAESTTSGGTLFTVKLPQEKASNEVLGWEAVKNLRQLCT